MKPTPYWVDRRHGWEPVNKMPKPTKSLRFEYWKSAKNKQWYWRIRAGNAEPIAHGEGYKRKSGVLNVFHLLFNFEAQPDCVDVTPVKWGKLNRNWP
jgi:uncharacterized protein YegP (UPF0339 family)